MKYATHKLGAILSLLMLFGAAPVSAATLSGDMTFSGDIADGMLASATMISFPGNDFDVDGATGDFSGILQGDIGSIADFDLTGPVSFSIAGFSFLIDTLNIDLQTSNVLLLSGSGTASAAGFDTTAVLFTFSANDVGPLTDFSAGVTTVIPVPGALVLFVSALAGLGLRRR